MHATPPTSPCGPAPAVSRKRFPVANAWALHAVAALVFLAGPAFAGEDTWTGVDRIVAVGDVHGDFGQFVKALRAAQVIDENNDWTGGKTHLVQTGDVLDRGPDSRKAMDLLMKLEEQASRTGGMVHALIGNHEAMVLLGDVSYVSPEEDNAFGGAKEYRAAMGAEGKYGRWIRSHNAVIKINDLVFVHAGITPEYARQSLAEINKAVREDLEKGNTRGVAMDPSGPLWNRTLALGDAGVVAKELGEVLKSYAANRMVIGHTVATSGVRARAGDRLIRIDVGMFSDFGGPAACLVVEHGVFYEARHPDTKINLQLEAPAGKPQAPQPATPETPAAASQKAA